MLMLLNIKILTDICFVFQVQADQGVILVEAQDSLQQMVLFFPHPNYVMYSNLYS